MRIRSRYVFIEEEEKGRRRKKEGNTGIIRYVIALTASKCLAAREQRLAEFPGVPGLAGLVSVGVVARRLDRTRPDLLALDIRGSRESCPVRGSRSRRFPLRRQYPRAVLGGRQLRGGLCRANFVRQCDSRASY
jgi:hypothetical protein